MADQGNELEARMARVRKKLDQRGGVPGQGRRVAMDDREEGSIWWIIKAEIAFVLGFAALIGGRSLAIHGLGAVPSPDSLGRTEGAVVLGLLLVIGLLMGPKDFKSHAALIFGAGLAYMAESFYVPMLAGLMGRIYTPEYVGLLSLGG